MTRTFGEISALGDVIDKAWLKIRNDQLIFSLHTHHVTARNEIPLEIANASLKQNETKLMTDFRNDFKEAQINLGSNLIAQLDRREFDRFACVESFTLQNKVVGCVQQDLTDRNRLKSLNPPWKGKSIWYDEYFILRDQSVTPGKPDSKLSRELRTY